MMHYFLIVKNLNQNDISSYLKDINKDNANVIILDRKLFYTINNIFKFGNKNINHSIYIEIKNRLSNLLLWRLAIKLLNPKDQSDFIASIGGEVEPKYEVKLGYAHFSTSEILRHVLPDTVTDIPSHFETVGHIAHFNLREELLPKCSMTILKFYLIR